MEFNLPRRKQKDVGIEMGPLMDIVFIRANLKKKTCS